MVLKEHSTRRSEMVLVTNMSMPKTCEDCCFEYDFRCFAGDGDYKDIETYSMGIKPEWCPIVDIRPCDLRKLFSKEK